MAYLRSLGIKSQVVIEDFDHDRSFFGFNGAPNFFVHFVAINARLRRENA